MALSKHTDVDELDPPATPRRLLTKRKPVLSAKTMNRLERIRLTVLTLVLIGLSIYGYRSYLWSTATKQVYRLLEVEDSHTALEHIRTIEDKWGRTGETNFLRGRAYRHLGELELSDRALDQAAIEKYNQPRLDHEQLLLDVQYTMSTMDKAIVDTVLESYQADFAENATALARGLMRLDETEGVLGVLGLWKTQEPDSYRIDYLAGMLAARANLFDDALTQFEMAYEKEPNYVPVWLELGKSYWRKNDPRKAYDFFKKYSDVRPDDAEAEGGQIETLLAIGEFEKVNEYFDSQSIVLDLNSRARIFRAQAYEGVENYEAVITTLVPLVQAWPDDTEANQLLSVAYQATGQKAKAAEHAVIAEESTSKQGQIAALRQALSQDPANADAHYQLGHLLLNLMSRPEGFQHLQTALSLNPNMKEAHLDLSRFYFAAGNSEMAQKHRNAVENVGQ